MGQEQNKDFPFEIQSRLQRGRVSDAPSRHWVYRVLPRRFWPYAQLARLDRPIGWQLLTWPCWWSVALVIIATRPVKEAYAADNLFISGWYLLLFLIGAVVMRGAGCTYNDLVDEKIDMAVERTRSRPLPSGQVSRLAAKCFLLVQLLIGLIVLLQFNLFTIVLGAASLGIVALYPFMKRITDWPQLVLGLAFNWGALLGWAALTSNLGWSPFLLYAGAVCWTIGYDTIYAHQDREDDALVGVRSTARLFGCHTMTALMVFYGAMLGLIGAAFVLAGVGFFGLSGLGLVAFHLIFQITYLDINRSEQCLMLFRSNFHIGWMIFAGLVLDIIFDF